MISKTYTSALKGIIFNRIRTAYPVAFPRDAGPVTHNHV